MKWRWWFRYLNLVAVYGLVVPLCTSVLIIAYFSGPSTHDKSTLIKALSMATTVTTKRPVELHLTQQPYYMIVLEQQTQSGHGLDAKGKQFNSLIDIKAAKAPPPKPPAKARKPPAKVQKPPAKTQKPPAKVQKPPAKVQKPPAKVQKLTPPKKLVALKRVRGQNVSIFVFTAIIGNSSHNASWDTLSILGWEAKHFNKNLSCCVHYKSGNVSLFPLSSYRWLNFSAMVATQYTCPLQIPENDTPAYVTVATSMRTCHNLLNWYLIPTFSYRHENQVAVCAKLAYGNLSSDDVLAWFEVHKRLGMNKALTFTYKLNPDATRVLEYYRSVGLAELVPFELPETGESHPDVGVKTMQAWSDEQVCVYDCLERLKGYEYVLTIDFDEYILPKRDKSLPEMLDRLFKKSPSAAGFHFLVQLYITSWGQTGYQSKFKPGQYLNRTKAMQDRMKHVVRPDRVHTGGLATHGFTPNYKLGYKKGRVSEEDAVIQHFRSCRKDWGKRNKTRCEDLQRYTDSSLADFMLKIERDVLSLKRTIFPGG